MTWRIHVNETNWSDAQLLAWEHVCPYRCLPLLDCDYEKAGSLANYLEKSFSKPALKAAVKRTRLVRSKGDER